ncbi:MAG: elongation factor P maturation arginine rhamnosyltransferase EarP [Candidatus Margulisbacteria bacterium]|nr:elongation factor P maturation arginine rhamnosyltransferase EarP [Candidatus Margulisiibacteriota bacterium]
MKLKDNNIDIFCQVVDNYGDAGYSYRLARALKLHRTDRQVRLFINELHTLAQLLPELDVTRAQQNIEGVDIIIINDQLVKRIQHLQFASLIIESLSSPVPEVFRKQVYSQSQLIFILEHLTAEPAFEAMHGLSAPTGYDIPRYLIAQGLTAKSAGILIEANLPETVRAASGKQLKWRQKWLKPYADILPFEPETAKTGSLFSYDHDFSSLLCVLQKEIETYVLFILGDLSQQVMREALNQEKAIWLRPDAANLGSIYILFPEMFSQQDYDLLLFTMDFNMVRGEDSLARAILSGKPFLWQAYDQGENYQLVKVNALMQVLENYAENSLVFKNYAELTRAYNWRFSITHCEQPQENYCYFFKNFATIQRWLNRLRGDLLAQGGIIPAMERFVESL